MQKVFWILVQCTHIHLNYSEATQNEEDTVIKSK